MTDPANPGAAQGAQSPTGPAPDPEATVVMQEQETSAEQQALTQELARELANSKDLYMRALAELDNVRKRAQKDVESAHRYGLEKFALELLPVKDSLELGLEAGEKARKEDSSADIKSLLAGKEATLKLFSRAFEKFNINEINPVGAPFDPQLHEAMMAQASATAEPDSVLQVIQKGYQLNGRLLRPARVIVAKAPGA